MAVYPYRLANGQTRWMFLGLWAGEHGDGERAKFWQRVLSEIKNRGTHDVLMLVCDGLKGLPDAVNTVWPKTIVQTCVAHLLRNSFRYTSKRDWPELARDLIPVYTAPSAQAALDRFAEFSDKWERRYPRPFVCGPTRGPSSCRSSSSTSRSARSSVRRTRSSRSTPDCAEPCGPAGTSRPSRPPSSASTALMGLDPTGRGRGRWTMRWTAALNAFDIAFDGRLSAGRS